MQSVGIDPVSIDSTFFVVPNRGAERAYALLYEALCRSGLFGVAQITMHSRESVVVLRPSGNGIVAQTLFYEPEIRANVSTAPGFDGQFAGTKSGPPPH